jgi:peptidyl-tRNA hydrolase
VRKKYDFPEFKEEKKFKALISNPSIPQPLFPSQETGKKILLVKPTTFMNLS